MSEYELENNLKTFNIKKNYHENIYHNKIYLFNTQIIENNIKDLKKSIMQKTQFLHKHDLIDNMQREIKYEFRKNEKENKTNVKNQNFLISNENNYFPIENNNNGNLLNKNEIDYNFSVILKDQVKRKNNQNELEDKTSGFLAKESIEKERNLKLYSISHPNEKGDRNKTKSRFLTSIEDSNGLLINKSHNYNTKTKLQKLSKKINLKSRNTVDVSIMKGISEDDNDILNKSNKSVIKNEKKINTHLQINLVNYNLQNDINNDGKYNVFLNLNEKEKKQLKEKIISNENESNVFNHTNKEIPNDLSKSNSELKIKERDIILNLNLYKNMSQKKSESNVEYLRFNKANSNIKIVNPKIKTIKNSYNLHNNDDLIKLGHLNPKDYSISKTQENIYTLLDNQLKLFSDSSKKKFNNLKSQFMTMEEFKRSTNYLLSKPNLITNTEINANIKKNSKDKFYIKTNSKSLNICEKKQDENNSKFKYENKEINKLYNLNKSNILINENYNQPWKILNDFQATHFKNSKEIKNKSKRMDISENYKNSNLNQINAYIGNREENFILEEIDYDFKQKDEDINREIKTQMKLSSEKSLNSERIINDNKTNDNKNINSGNLSKLKITDRIALMSKGILKESYDTETDKIFSKIFNKNLEEILEMKKYPIRAASLEKLNLHDERFKFSKRNSISKEITDLKEKVYFLKGTLDYIFPQYLIGKLNETAKKQKLSNFKKINGKINESNIVTLTSENESFKKSFCKTKSNNKNKEVTNGIFIVENTDKNSSNGNSKNEFFFPNINTNTNNINKFNNHPINNNYNITIYNTLDVNNNQINDTFENNEAINIKNENMKKKIKENFNLINSKTTKLISSQTNSSLFYKFNNFKNKSKNHSNNYLFANNPLNDLPFPEQKRIIKKQILSKTNVIQNTNSFNN